MINLILADDHSVIRQALSEMLEAKGKYKILAQAENGEQLLQLLLEHHPDIIVMDMSMPRMDGVAALEKMTSKEAGCPPVLILSSDEGERSVRAALKAGARGYLPKNVEADELVFAIDSILDGKTYLSPSITAPLMTGGGADSAIADGALAALTKREVEILTLLADGKPNREIGKMLHISTRTVDTHRSNILKKLKLKTNAELVKVAIQNGLINV